MGSYKSELRRSTVGQAIADACSELTSLGEECREVYDNSSEGLQQTQRLQTMDETASTLESVQAPDVPEALADVPLEYHEMVQKRRGRGTSRATRRDNAVAMLEAAVDALQNYAEDVESLVDELDEIKSNAEGVEFPGMYG